MIGLIIEKEQNIKKKKKLKRTIESIRRRRLTNIYGEPFRGQTNKGLRTRIDVSRNT